MFSAQFKSTLVGLNLIYDALDRTTHRSVEHFEDVHQGPDLRHFERQGDLVILQSLPCIGEGQAIEASARVHTGSVARD